MIRGSSGRFPAPSNFRSSVILISSLLLLFVGSRTQAQDDGYSDLHSLCKGMVDAFQTMDDEVLMEFCERLAVNPSTVEFMNENTLCYRGIPCDVDQPGKEVEIMADKFYQPLLRVRNDLASKGLLKGLKPAKKWTTNMT